MGLEISSNPSNPLFVDRLRRAPDTMTFPMRRRDGVIGRRDSRVSPGHRTAKRTAYIRWSQLTPFSLAILPAGDALTSSSRRSEDHTSELQSLMRTSYAVCCLKNKNT